MPSLQARIIKRVLRTRMADAFKSVDDWPSRRTRIEKNERFARLLDHGFTRSEGVIGSIPCQWITTPNSDPNTILLYLHGGGFCIRTPVVHGQFIAKLCAGSQTLGLMPDYRLAPEHPFPAAYEDCFSFYSALLDQGFSPEKIVFAGDSAGGSLVIGTLFMIRDADLPMPACGVLFSPGLGALHDPALFNHVKDGPLLRRDAMLTFGKAFGTNRFPDHPLAVLIDNDFTGLPPLLFQVGGDEILLHDSIKGAAKAEGAGVEVRLEMVEGMMHVFPLFPFLPEASCAVQHAAEFIRQHLSADA